MSHTAILLIEYWLFHWYNSIRELIFPSSNLNKKRDKNFTCSILFMTIMKYFSLRQIYAAIEHEKKRRERMTLFSDKGRDEKKRRSINEM